MPMPKPKKNEEKKDFLSRCMGNDVMVEDYPDNKQRYAICNQIWRDKDKDSIDIKIKKKKSYLEKRSYPFEITEVRRIKDEPIKIIGFAAVFNKLSVDLGGFREKIDPEFFSDVLGDDVVALFNHDSNLILGRTSNKTLILGEDNKGLPVEILPPDTTYARDLLVLIDRGDVKQMSFQWITAKDEWDTTNLNKVIRTLIKAKSLIDVSPVVFPAYPQTKVDVRSAKQVYIDYLEELLENNSGEVEKDEKWQNQISLLEKELEIIKEEI